MHQLEQLVSLELGSYRQSLIENVRPLTDWSHSIELPTITVIAYQESSQNQHLTHNYPHLNIEKAMVGESAHD